MSLLQLKNVNKTYKNGVEVLKEVSFSIEKKQCIGLVGESGCGKSTLARCILQLDSIDQGEILLDGVPLQNKNDRQLRAYRKDLQAVMQNPSSSLNPKLKIRDSLLEPIRQTGNKTSLNHFRFTDESKFAEQLMASVELSGKLLDHYPHELSGGQKQRISIARAISIEPALVVLDEPTSSLDVLTQAAILKLLNELKDQLDLSYLFISHDLAAVSEMSQQILVMKEGSLIDRFEQDQMFSVTRQEYTKQLISLYE